MRRTCGIRGQGVGGPLTTMMSPRDLGIGILFERIRLAMIVAEAESGRIVLWNPDAEQLFGYTASEAAGLSLAALMPERLRADHLAGMARYQATGHGPYVDAPAPLELAALRKDGQEIAIELSLSALPDAPDGTRYALGVIRDITERVRAAALSHGQQHLLELVARGTPLPQVLEALVRFIEAQSPELLGSVLLLDDDRLHLRLGAAPELPDAFNREIDGQAIGPEAGSCGTAAYSGLPVIVTDIATDHRWVAFRDLAAAHGLRACWSTPILSTAGRVLGTFALYYRQPRAPAAWELLLTQTATRIAGIAIERRQAEESLRSSEAQLRSVLATAPIALLTCDADGIITMALGALHLLGLPAGLLLGRSVFASMAEHDEALAAFIRARAGQPQIATIERQGRTLELRWLPSSDALGALAEVIGVVVDVTERARDQALAEQGRRAAEDLARLRSDFVASVSHELRTPLTAVIGYAELLAVRWEHWSDEERRARLELIRMAAQRQQRVVEDLLLISQVDAGGLRLAREPLDLAALLARASAEVGGAYRDQRIALEGAPGITVLADPGRTLQVLVNLLDNAAKYSPEGSPILVSWGRDGTMGVVRVCDHGAGIPEGERERLFTRFGRLQGSRTRAGRVGTGLGLYLSRTFARAMGGELELETSGPEGSTFRLQLPADPG